MHVRLLISQFCNLAPLGPLAPLEPLAALEPLALLASFHEGKWCKWLKWRKLYKWPRPSGPSGASGARLQDLKIAVPPAPIVHTRARLADCTVKSCPPLPSEASLPAILPRFPKNSKKTKVRKIDCTFLVGYRTSFPHTLYYYYYFHSYYYY